MRIEWLNKKGTDRLIIFFNGWGMDATAVSHLTTECDVVMFYDYCNLAEVVLPSLTAYQKIYVVAWSMGVWGAANVICNMQIHPDRLIAINGTECPINDQWGIPLKVYLLTERGMTLQGMEKFIQRMLNGQEEIERFKQQKSSRTIDEVCKELEMIRKQYKGLRNKLNWDKVYVSENDFIFPVINQLNWWEYRAIRVQKLLGGHYPFYCFRKWEDIIYDNYGE